MIELLYTAADGTFPNGYQKTVGLGELRIVQAVKQILNVNLKRAKLWEPLSHAFSEFLETWSMPVSRWLRWSAHCFSHTPGEDVLFALEP
jgi:hypothetical protein